MLGGKYIKDVFWNTCTESKVFSLKMSHLFLKLKITLTTVSSITQFFTQVKKVKLWGRDFFQ